MNHIALLSLDKGDYSSAESSLERALDIYRQVPPSENAGLATTLNTLGALYRGQGDYDRAEASLKEALKIDEQTLGTGHPEVAATLNNLAELFHDKGDYGEAERLYEQARQVWERALGAQHPRIATVLNNLAVLYQDKGDYTRAQSQLQKALALRIKNVGRVHPQVGILFNNLGGLYRAQGDLNCAAQLYEQAREIWERTLGPEHPHVITLLNNLAGLYRVQGNESAALSRLQRVLDYREKVLGSMHPDVGTTLNNLAELYRIKGAYEQAEPHYTRASELKAQGLARKHPHVATIQHNLALLYQAKGEVKKAVAAMTDSAEIREHNLTVVLGTGSEEQRRSYTATLAGETNSAVSLHARVAPYDVQARDLALTTILRRKGRVLDAMANDRGILRRHLDPQAQDLLEALSAVYTQLSTVIHRGPTAPPAEQYNAEVARLEEQADQLERALSARSAAFRAQSQPVTLNTVQAAIPEGAVLVEFLWYTPVHPEAQTALERWGEARYVAYVLRQTGAPTWIDLGEAAAIDQAVSRLRDALGDPARTDVQSLARALDEQVMRPLRPLLGDSHLVLVSPDGVLNLIPFTALVDEEHHYLVERFTFTYLTSGRDLLRLQVGARSRSGPVILASPNYYLDVTGSHLSQQRWLPLPGTLEEADALKGLLPGAVTLTWQEATEEALKGIQGPRILHTATHGFFLSDSAIENPLLRSGLVLAGANGRTSRQEDGLATARELSELDLWGTQLVVLSACETGVGEVHSGEGVYGLRRALVLAGAEAQVMSLWKVSDAATRDLMVAYYRSLISDGEGRAAALRHVQRTMWRSGDRAHPFYWASFIHSGQWTPLSDEGREGGPSSVVSPEPGKP